MLNKFFTLIVILGLCNVALAGNNREKLEQNTTQPDQLYLIQTQSLINQKFPVFFSKLKLNEQLMWIKSVAEQAERYGYDNNSLKEGFTIISCYLGKDFMSDERVDKDIKKYLKDERFSKYVRVRDIQRFLERKKHKLEIPSSKELL